MVENEIVQGTAHWDGENWTVNDGQSDRIILQAVFFQLFEGQQIEYIQEGETEAKLIELPVVN